MPLVGGVITFLASWCLDGAKLPCCWEINVLYWSFIAYWELRYHGQICLFKHTVHASSKHCPTKHTVFAVWISRLSERAMALVVCGAPVWQSFQYIKTQLSVAKDRHSVLWMTMPKRFCPLNLTISAAQGGGKSFKDRKPIKEVSCRDAWMAKPTHW